jgi:hypothetical protein
LIGAAVTIDTGERAHMRRAASLILLGLMASCGSPTAPDIPADAIRVTGTVHYYTFEGGFWAVRGDDNVTYDPLGGLPQAFQRENLRVSMAVKVRNDLASIHMAGPIVEIIEIEAM